MRELIDELRARFGRSVILEFRMDAAFFQENILKLLDRRGCFYAIKVPFCPMDRGSRCGRRATPLEAGATSNHLFRNSVAA